MWATNFVLSLVGEEYKIVCCYKIGLSQIKTQTKQRCFSYGHDLTYGWEESLPHNINFKIKLLTLSFFLLSNICFFSFLTHFKIFDYLKMKEKAFDVLNQHERNIWMSSFERLTSYFECQTLFILNIMFYYEGYIVVESKFWPYFDPKEWMKTFCFVNILMLKCKSIQTKSVFLKLQ